MDEPDKTKKDKSGRGTHISGPSLYAPPVQNYQFVFLIIVFLTLIIKIFFSIHAFFASTVTGLQILCYESNDQRVSYVGGAFAVICVLTAALGTIAPSLNAISWLDYLTILSSIKLAITIVKYVPQAWMNYR